MNVIGIDAGATGAIACYDAKTGDIPWVERFDGRDPAEVIHGLGLASLAVAVEKVHAMPGQGVVSMFTFGTNYGRILGALTCCNVKPVLVPPQTWQKCLQDDSALEAQGPKERVKSFCEAKWGLKRFIFEGCRVPHQGAMDAAVIAYWLGTGGTVTEKGKKPKSRRPISLTA